MSHMNKVMQSHSQSIVNNVPPKLKPIDTPLFWHLFNLNYVAPVDDGWLKEGDKMPEITDDETKTDPQ